MAGQKPQCHILVRFVIFQLGDVVANCIIQFARELEKDGKRYENLGVAGDTINSIVVDHLDTRRVLGGGCGVKVEETESRDVMEIEKDVVVVLSRADPAPSASRTAISAVGLKLSGILGTGST